MNAEMTQKETEEFCMLGEEEKQVVKEIFETNEFSTRRYYRMLKLARTIADLDESADIRVQHLIEAYQYCNTGKKYWKVV